MSESFKRGRKPEDRIETMLVEAGLITQADLATALKRQHDTGGRLIDILITEGALDSRQFVELLARPGGFPTIDIEHFEIDPEVIALVPKEFALKNEVVPIDRLGKVLTIATIVPLDSAAIDSLEAHCGLRVKCLLCSTSDVRANLTRHYSDKKPAADDSTQAVAGALKLTSAVTMLRRIDSLPALPGTVQQVREMLYDEEGSTAEVAEVISRDPAIAAKILRVANSAAYGLPHRVDNIQLAVTLLGLLETYSVVVSSAVINFFDRSRGFDYMTFWLESMVCATMGTALSRSIDIRNRTGIFSAGLLHDIGRVALAQVAPRQYGRVDRKLVGLDLVAAEEEVLGLSHAEAGYQLAQHWDLPIELAESIRFHHSPGYASPLTKSVVAMVNIADVLSRAHRPDSPTREVNFDECRESMAHLEIAESDVLEVFNRVSSADPEDPLWSPN